MIAHYTASVTEESHLVLNASSLAEHVLDIHMT